jgi:hypothetical protein
MIDELSGLERHYRENRDILTAYESKQISTVIQDKKREYRATIRTAIDAQRKAAQQAYGDAAARVGKARIAEHSRWDAAKLNAEMELAERRIEQAVKFRLDGTSLAERIGDIYEEARSDNHKVRALFEMLQAALAKARGDDARQIAYVLNEVQDDLRQMRDTPELQAARQAEQDARHELEQEAELTKHVYQLTDLGADGERELMRSEMDVEKTIEELNALRASEGKPALTPNSNPTAPSTW